MTDTSEMIRVSGEVREMIERRPPTREEALILLSCIDTLIGIVTLGDFREALSDGRMEDVESHLETLAILLDPVAMAAIYESMGGVR